MNPKLSEAKSSFMYARATINIRASPSLEGKIVGRFFWNEPMKIIRRVNKRWYQISYKKKKRYVSAKYLKKNKSVGKKYSVPNNKAFKSYEDAECITNSYRVAHGRLKRKYHLDPNTGVWMVGNRYCIALGSFYTRKIGTKVDLILSYKGKTSKIKCIIGDCKADKDTVDKHRIHRDGSVVEFIVKTSRLPPRVKLTGDLSFANKKFRGRVVKIRIY